MNKAFLWSQALNTTSNDFCVIDGTFSEYDRTVEQYEALSEMNRSDFRQQAVSHPEGCSPSFRKRKRKGWLYVQGNYQEKDDIGRLRVYRFIIKSDDWSEARQTLVAYSQQIGCTPFAADLEQLESNKNNLKKTVLWIIITIALAIITVLAISFCDSSR